MAMGKLGKALKSLRTARSARGTGRKAARRAQSRPDQRRYHFEPLEDRRLLSATSFEPKHYFELNDNGTLSGAASGEPLAVAREYLSTNAAQFGLEPGDVQSAAVTDMYTDTDTGVTHIYLQETFHGLGVVNSSLAINIAADGSVLNVGGDMVGGLASLEKTSSAALPRITAAKALEFAATALGLGQREPLRQIASQGLGLTQQLTFEDADLSSSSISTKLNYVATAEGMKLAWNALLQPSSDHLYDVSIDTSSGSLLRQYDLVEHETATYRVLGIPTESPDDPDVTPDPWVSTTVWGTRDVITNLPTVTDSSDPSSVVGSPYGWHDTNGVADGANTTNTSGNNAITTPLAVASVKTTDLLDTDTNLAFYDRPRTAPTRPTTNYSLDLTKDPTAYVNAAATNAFYWLNLLHDIHYVYGFDEAAGNFQTLNYGGLGVAGDRVQVSVQIIPLDPNTGLPVYNVADFATPPDGQSPTMRLGVFSSASPRRDADLDNEVIIHEYGHGVTNRLVGGPANYLALQGDQSGGMGEGWGDFWAMMFTQKPGDTQNASYPMGTYTAAQFPSGNGIRRYPYSYDMNVDPLTFGTYNQSSEVHDAGEIWASTLWDLNWLLVDKYGYDPNIGGGYTGAVSAGNELMLQLVMDSLKLLPARPTFLDGRDAMLLADRIRTGGANQELIWQAFARRGMGLFAYDGGSDIATTVTEDFTRPPSDPFVTATTPKAEVASLGHMDFRFSEAMNTNSFSVADDVVSFTGPNGVDLKASLAAQMSYSWLDSTSLRVTIPRQDDAGLYTLTVGPQILSADSTGHGMDQNRNGTWGEAADAISVSVSVVPDTFGYQAVSTAYENISLVGDGASNTLAATSRDDGYSTVPLGSNTFRFYGSEFTGSNQLYVYVNGVITLGGVDAGLSYVNGDLRQSPEWPTIAPYWDDLYMNRTTNAASRISYKIDGNRLIIEWARMSPYGYQPPDNTAVPGETVTFQAILELNTGENTGNITFNYPDLGAGPNSNGVSATVGIKDYGIAGSHRLVVAEDEERNPYLQSGLAVMLVDSGTIAGRVFEDKNGNGTQESNEPGLADWGVYLDLNSSGSYDAGDKLATTDPQGNYLFEYLPWGDYSVRQFQNQGWKATAPSSVAYPVTLRSGLDLSGLLFGDQYVNTAPRIVDQSFQVQENAPAGTVAVNRAYVADGTAGLQILNVTNPTSVTRLGGYDTVGTAYDVQVVGTLVYVADGTAGLQILDVSDPASVTLLGGYDTAGTASAVQVVGNLAYVADGSAGLQILNISNPASVTRVGGYDTPGSATGVQLVGNRVYVIDGTAGLQILDVSNPASPVRLGGYDTAGTAADLQLVGTLAYVADGTAGLQILDVSNPANVTRLGGYDTAGTAAAVQVLGNTAYVADGTAGLQILDVSNSANPTLLGGYDTAGTAAAVQVLGKLAYVADGTAGLLALDVSRPARVTRLGGYDYNVAGVSSGIQVAGMIAASDLDLPKQGLTYEILSGNDSGAFAIDPRTGVITVADPTKLDYEVTATFNLMVRVTDSVNPPLSSSANIAIRLINVDEPPVATADAYYVPAGNLLNVTAPGVLANDSDPERGLLSVALDTGPLHAQSFQLGPDGSFSYRPNAGYTGPDSFWYRITDPGGQSDTVQVKLTIGDTLVVNFPAPAPGLELDPKTGLPQVWESKGAYPAAGQVSVLHAFSSDIVITLSTDDTDNSELSVPKTVTLPAGQTSVSFDVTALDDTAEDGTQTITVTAAGGGLYSGSAKVDVRDNDLSHFAITPISGPQVANVPFRVDVEARDAGNQTIDIYGGAGFFAANAGGLDVPGVTWTTYVAAGEQPPEQAFKDGLGSFLVTIPTQQSSVQLVVSDSLAASSHKGWSNRFDVHNGSVSRFEIGPISSPQWASTVTDSHPVLLTVAATDANGLVVQGYSGQPEITAWTARQATASTIVISEIGDGTPDFLEIQNVTNAAVSTRGWSVVVNDPDHGANAVLPQQWALPDLFAARGVEYRSDDPADASHYWGGNIPWGASSAQGWVMIIDDQFAVRDFVAWGYDAYTIERLIVDVGATSIRVYDPAQPEAREWTGDGKAYGGTATLTLQRMANRDGNAAADLAWLASSFQQTNPSLVLPFGSGVTPVSMHTAAADGVSLVGFNNGTFGGGVYVDETAVQVFFRINDRMGHIGESVTFDVLVAPPPAHSATPGVYDPSASTFYLKNTNTAGFADSVFGYGPAPSSWIPIVGDWDGDGRDTVGLYDPASSTFYLTNNTNGMATIVFGFGAPAAGWKPLAGDWNGDGIDTVGLYNSFNATFYLTDSNVTGMANRLVGYGPPKNGWTPIAGNWDGKGGDGIGLYSPNDSVFYLKNEPTLGTADLTFGFGAKGWTPLAGDWDGNGADSIGVFDPKSSEFYQRNTNNSGYADRSFGYGNPNGQWLPVVGDWDGTASLMAVGEPMAATVSGAALDAGQLSPVVTVALAQWSGVGLDRAAVERLAQVHYVVADLPGAELGRVQGQTVYLDVNGAGRGWFVDPTPALDEEFASSGAALDPAALDRMDLLTVVAHELGHVAGLEHLTGEDALMSATLESGLRRTAGLAERDALFASGLDES